MSSKRKLYFSLVWGIHFWSRIKAGLGQKCFIFGYYDKHSRRLLKRCRVASTAIITGRNNLVLQDNVRINHYARIDASGGLTIGEGCQIGYGSCILTHSTHNSIRLMGAAFMEYSPTNKIGYISKQSVIGDYTFVGGEFYSAGNNGRKGLRDWR